MAMSLLDLAFPLLLLAAGDPGAATAAMPAASRPAPPPAATAATATPAAGPAGLAGPAGDTARFQDEVAVNDVLVPVMVRTRSGYANHLEAKDFRLSVDGRPVRIESFDKNSEAPTSLVFLQDLSG